MARINRLLIALLGIAVLACPVVFALRHARAQTPAPGSPTSAASASTIPVETSWVVPDIDKLADDDWGRTVRYGRDLVAKTASLMAPKSPTRLTVSQVTT